MSATIPLVWRNANLAPAVFDRLAELWRITTNDDQRNVLDRLVEDLAIAFHLSEQATKNVEVECAIEDIEAAIDSLRDVAREMKRAVKP